MQVLITGANGYLGSQLLFYFARQFPEWHLHGLFRQGAKLNRLGWVQDQCQLHSLDSDPTLLADLIHQIKPDVIVHTACSYGRNHESAIDVLQANVVFGARLLDALLALKRPVTFLNTGSALEPKVSVYALTKSQFSDYGRMIGSQAEYLQFLNINLQHMYGAGDDESKFPTRMVRMLLNNLSEIELTEGLQRRDFIHIEDVASAYAFAILHRDQFKKTESIDLGSGNAPTIREFVQLAKKLTGAASELKFGCIPMRPDEPALCIADTSRLNELGWVPQFTLESGLKQMIEQERTQ